MADEGLQTGGKPSKEQPIIIKKIKKGGHGHHGGAWKVAYADFVTAMMAFFIVMWILAASEETKKQITAYFDNPGAFSFITGKMTVPIDLGLRPVPGKKYGNESGEGLGDETKELNIKLEDSQLDSLALKVRELKKQQAVEDSIAAAQRLEEVAKEMKEYFEKLAEKNPSIKKTLESVEFQNYADGLRIELIETDESTFFQLGSAILLPETKEILKKLAYELGKLPNFVEVEGHTDSRGYTGGASYSNWELSTDRANAARRALEAGGFWAGQNTSVTGFADRILKVQENPYDSRNRRVSILIKPLTVQELME